MIFSDYTEWQKFPFKSPIPVIPHVDREETYVVFESERYLITETNYKHTRWETWCSLYVPQTCLTRYYTLLFIWLHILKKYRVGRYHSVRLRYEIKYVLIYNIAQKLPGILPLVSNLHLYSKTWIPNTHWMFRW